MEWNKRNLHRRILRHCSWSPSWILHSVRDCSANFRVLGGYWVAVRVVLSVAKWPVRRSCIVRRSLGPRQQARKPTSCGFCRSSRKMRPHRSKPKSKFASVRKARTRWHSMSLWETLQIAWIAITAITTNVCLAVSGLLLIVS